MSHQCKDCLCPLTNTAINGVCLTCYIKQINFALDELTELTRDKLFAIRHALQQVENATRK